MPQRIACLGGGGFIVQPDNSPYDCSPPGRCQNRKEEEGFAAAPIPEKSGQKALAGQQLVDRTMPFPVIVLIIVPPALVVIAAGYLLRVTIMSGKEACKMTVEAVKTMHGWDEKQLGHTKLRNLMASPYSDGGRDIPECGSVKIE
jgi:hypothetical protein